MKPILEILGVSKKFVIGHQRVPYLSLREKISNAFKRNVLTEEFWALQDVSLQIMPGESVGIIGRNGAGKSTLLKILSRITPPTKGKIITRGRIASLLEVGTGFHQELTGRENIFMNGSILGMKHQEIKARFDEIVDFSGTEKFLDTPLKHFSSGMQLRLAFAVAAHLEPEILIIDEVLAVGDAEFQKKCLRKMEAVTGQGRTVLFVSHNLPSLKSICSRGALLQEGRLVFSGTIEEVIDHYSSFQSTEARITEGIHYYDSSIKINEISINDSTRNEVAIRGESGLRILLDVSFVRRMPFELIVHIKKEELRLASFANFVDGTASTYEPGRYQLEYTIDVPPMRSGKYTIDLFFEETFVSWMAVSENTIELQVLNDHSIHLNNPALKWGGFLLKGKLEKSGPV